MIVPDGSGIRFEVDKYVHIANSFMLTKAFVYECRSNPAYAHLLQWVNLVFRPSDISGMLPFLGSELPSFSPISDEKSPGGVFDKKVCNKNVCFDDEDSASVKYNEFFFS